MFSFFLSHKKSNVFCLVWHKFLGRKRPTGAARDALEWSQLIEILKFII